MIARSTARAIVFGIAAAVVVGFVYAIISEPLELTPSLLAVGFFGGWFIGHAVSYGAWSDKPHEPDRQMQWTALALVTIAWVGALFLAFAISQALVPNSSVPLADKLTIGGFFDYMGGLEAVPLLHVVSFALMAVMAWRGAR